MIDHVRFYETVGQAARSGSSGYFSGDEWNRNLAAVETDLFNMMAPLYSSNFQVQDMLSPFVKSEEGVLSGGILVKPEGFSQFISAEINGNPVYPLNLNEVAIVKSSPTRKPSIENNQYYNYFKNDKIYFEPSQVAKVNFDFLGKPIPGEILLTEVSSEDSDYVTVTSTRDLEWPEKAFNILMYLMLEKFGIDQRESIAYEYAQIGIQREIVKT